MRGRDTPMCGRLWRAPYWRPGSQLRHVPWLGIELVALCFEGCTQSTEPHQPGCIFKVLKFSVQENPNLGLRTLLQPFLGGHRPVGTAAQDGERTAAHNRQNITGRKAAASAENGQVLSGFESTLKSMSQLSKTPVLSGVQPGKGNPCVIWCFLVTLRTWVPVYQWRALLSLVKLC